MPRASPRRSTSAATSSAAIALRACSRSIGIRPIAGNSRRVVHESMYSALPMKNARRGIDCSRATESKNEMWLAATITPPCARHVVAADDAHPGQPAVQRRRDRLDDAGTSARTPAPRPRPQNLVPTPAGHDPHGGGRSTVTTRCRTLPRPPSTMWSTPSTEVVGRCAADEDRTGYFAAMYLAVTHAVRQRADEGRFADRGPHGAVRRRLRRSLPRRRARLARRAAVPGRRGRRRSQRPGDGGRSSSSTSCWA